MNVSDLSTSQKYAEPRNNIIKTNSWTRNQLAKLYNVVSAPLAATRDVLAEKLENICETAGLLYAKMMDNMGHGERLKDIVEKKAKKKQQK